MRRGRGRNGPSADPKHELALRAAGLARVVRARGLLERERRRDVRAQLPVVDERRERLETRAIRLDEQRSHVNAGTGQFAQRVDSAG